MTRISITVTTVRVVDLLAEGERMPVYVHVIDHPDARTGRARSDRQNERVDVSDVEL